MSTEADNSSDSEVEFLETVEQTQNLEQFFTTTDTNYYSNQFRSQISIEISKPISSSFSTKPSTLRQNFGYYRQKTSPTKSSGTPPTSSARTNQAIVHRDTLHNFNSSSKINL